MEASGCVYFKDAVTAHKANATIADGTASVEVTLGGEVVDFFEVPSGVLDCVASVRGWVETGRRMTWGA